MPKQGRSAQEWLEQVRGDCGRDKQNLACKDLSAYLYKVAYNSLRRRQGLANPYILTTFGREELAALAEDFMQETMEKLASNNFARLEQFQGKGPFTYWVAVILHHLVADELRKLSWERRDPLPPIFEREDEEAQTFKKVISSTISVEKQVMQKLTNEKLQGCLEGLQESRRLALLGIVFKTHRVQELVKALERPSSNAVYMLVREGKRDIKKCLQKAGWDKDVFESFE